MLLVTKQRKVFLLLRALIHHQLCPPHLCGQMESSPQNSAANFSPLWCSLAKGQADSHSIPQLQSTQRNLCSVSLCVHHTSNLSASRISMKMVVLRILENKWVFISVGLMDTLLTLRGRFVKEDRWKQRHVQMLSLVIFEWKMGLVKGGCLKIHWGFFLFTHS